MKNKLLLLTTLAFLATGCTTTQKRIGTGAALGGATGAVIGHNDDGHAAEGALIGTLLGGLLGAHVDSKSSGKPYQETKTISKRKVITVKEEVPVHTETTTRKYYTDPETGRKVYID